MNKNNTGELLSVINTKLDGLSSDVQEVKKSVQKINNAVTIDDLKQIKEDTAKNKIDLAVLKNSEKKRMAITGLGSSGVTAVVIEVARYLGLK